MAAPLRKGRALALQRLNGVAFLVVMAVLVSLTVAVYQKRFTPVVTVELQATRAGNQLSTRTQMVYWPRRENYPRTTPTSLNAFGSSGGVFGSLSVFCHRPTSIHWPFLNATSR